MGACCVVVTNKLCSKFYKKKPLEDDLLNENANHNVIPTISQLAKDKDSEKLQKEAEREKRVSVVQFKSYNSTIDNLFIKIEKTFSFFQQIQLYEFLFLLTNVNVNLEKTQLDPNTSKRNSSNVGDIVSSSRGNSVMLQEISLEAPKGVKSNIQLEMSKEEFMIFIQNKIINNFLNIKFMNEKIEKNKIFEQYMSIMYDSLLAAKVDNFKTKNPGVKVKKGSIKTIKKSILSCLGFLYCSSLNRYRMEALFDLFANEELNFEWNEDLEEFFYYLFICPSTCALRALKNISGNFPEHFKEIGSDEFININDAFEIKDVHRLREIFLKDFFGDKKILNREEFYDKFIKGDFGWIFSSNGIRYFLQKHNNKE
jgi:hypothetical protein